jgi:hypothetical protein
MRKAVRLTLLLVIPLSAIVLAYPPTTYFRYFDFPFLVTFSSYLIVYVCSLGISLLAAPFVARKVTRSKGPTVFLQATVGIVGFAILTIICTATAFDLPQVPTRIHGIFFSEWKFLNFFFYVGVPVALLSALTALLNENTVLREEELLRLQITDRVP